MNILYLIPARGGSKGIPRKNIKKLNGKPLILYTIEVARLHTNDKNICISSEDDAILDLVKSVGFNICFKRPKELSWDNIGSYEVILNALNYYNQIDAVMLLQPTSPFRQVKHIREVISIYNNNIDMVLSVKKAQSDPYRLLFKENNNGNLEKLFKNMYIQRQDAPVLYEENGSIYLINIKSLQKYSSFNEFKIIKKYVMDPISSIDIDTEMDWKFAEFICEKELYKLDRMQ